MVYLLRHPQSIANVKQINSLMEGDITERGEWQIKRTLNRMKTLEICKVLSSPALRCRKLAESLGNDLGLKIELNDLLRERDYGSLAEKSGQEVFNLGYYSRPEGGESVSDVYCRAGCFFKNTHLSDQSVVVSHGLFLKMFMAHLLNVNPKDAVRVFKFSNCALTEVKNGLIEFLNDRNHLGKPIKKIHIFGGWGAGKTTLGNDFSKRFKIPIYHLDNLKYDGMRERSVQTRINMLDEITLRDSWITEGAWTSYAKCSFERADILIYCDTSKQKALQQAKSRDLMRLNLNSSHADILSEIESYHSENKEVSRKTHDSYYDLFNFKSTRTSNINLLQIEFLEDLWSFTKK